MVRIVCNYNDTITKGDSHPLVGTLVGVDDDLHYLRQQVPLNRIQRVRSVDTYFGAIIFGEENGDVVVSGDKDHDW